MGFLKKIRIFKRLKDLKLLIERFREENHQLKGQMIQRRKVIAEMKQTIMDLNNGYSLLAEKKDKATKHVATLAVANKELESRRDEFIKRLKSKIPDDVIGGRFENYKYWLAEPFIVKEYKKWHGVNDREAFVDQFAVYRGLDKVLEDEKERDGEDS
jgi:predicted nuclease with TOPRIM domain